MDILTRCMGSIAAEVVKCAKPVIRHVGYLFRFKKIVDDLTKATKDLQLVQQKVEEAIKLAKMNTEVVEKDVEGWLTDVDQLMKEVQDLENEVQGNLRFCNDWCPDWIRQYKLCKEAIKKTNVVQEIQKKGNFSKVAHRAPTPGIEIFSSSDFEVFESRKLAFQQIMEALHDDNNKRIGLHGIGGVGKTTLVKEVYKKVKELNIFKDIVMIVVSQTPDVRRIQGEIADCLQLKLEEESDTARANRVCLRIKNVEKILIMLDDVWKDVNLEAIGIPSCDDHRGCKMLLTTRSVHVCNLMRCQRKIPLNFLVEEESLALMKKIAIVDDCAVLNDVVLKVVKECKGLPIAIITVGKALIGKSLDDWNAAMHRLRKSRLVDIEEEKNEFKLRAYTRLERNTNLESATAISLIDYNTEQLPDNLECPRLKILLFGGIRSSKEISNALFKGMNCLQVLTLHDKILSSQSLKLLTNLRTLYLKGCNFSDDLSSLGKLKRLETLSFYKCGMVVLPSEFGEMESLKILDLTGCNQLKQIPPNVIRRLSQLEELFICESFKNWDVEGTTSEISNANLSELNSLPGLVILSLQLNLNHFPKGFVFRDLNRYYISINCQHRTPWKPHDYGRLTCIDSRTLEIEGLNASSMNALKKLFRTVEYIWIESCEMECIIDTICEGPNQYEIFSNLTGLVAHECPRLISLFSLSLAQSLKKLKQLRIRGCDEMKQVISDEEMILESHGQPICLSKLETLVVWKCGKLEYIFPISVARGLQQLERLRLRALPRLKKVFGQNREGEVGDCEIESHHQPTGFPKLETLDIWKCENLEYIFPISIAQDLPQLESLSLQDLPQLKQVFGQNREGEVGDCEIESHHQPTGFAKLKTLDVVNCGELEYIFPISVAGGLHQLERLDLVGLPRLKKVFGQNREGEVGDCEIESHHQPTSFPKLETILVCSCKNLEYIFPISIARDLPQLEILSLEGLPQLKQVFGHEEGGDDGDGNNSVLSKLRILRLENLPELVSLGGGDGSSLWPSLERLVVVNCPKVKLSFFANVEANVPALQKVIS
nr:putative disease resistance protein [Quercus suber]